MICGTPLRDGDELRCRIAIEAARDQFSVEHLVGGHRITPSATLVVRSFLRLERGNKRESWAFLVDLEHRPRDAMRRVIWGGAAPRVAIRTLSARDSIVAICRRAASQQGHFNCRPPHRAFFVTDITLRGGRDVRLGHPQASRLTFTPSAGRRPSRAFQQVFARPVQVRPLRRPPNTAPVDRCLRILASTARWGHRQDPSPRTRRGLVPVYCCSILPRGKGTSASVQCLAVGVFAGQHLVSPAGQDRSRRGPTSAITICGQSSPGRLSRIFGSRGGRLGPSGKYDAFDLEGRCWSDHYQRSR